MNSHFDRPTRSIYKNAEARDTIRRWCLARMAGWMVPYRTEEISLSCGNVHLTYLGDGPPQLMVLPGTNFNAATSPELADTLSRNWSTVIIDMPGQPGLSDERRPRSAHPLWYAAIVSEVLETLDVRDVTVIGHSLGAAVALACDSPRIGSRLLCSPAGIAPAHLDARLWWRSTAWFLAPNLRRSENLLGLFTAPSNRVPHDTVEWMDLVSQLCRSSLAPKPLPVDMLRQRAESPMLVATGEYDCFFPPSTIIPATRRQLRTVPRVLNGVGHLAVQERPGDLVTLIASLTD